MTRSQSENAKRVAREVEAQIIRGELINLSKASRKAGYSERSIRAMKPQKTKTYQREIVSVVDRIARIREDMLLALSNKDLDKEKASTLIEGLDKLTKNHQLLTGEATENTEFRIVEG
jgi:hypothetical protein